MATALELEAEANWEVEAARLGARRYATLNADKETHELSGGAALLRQSVGRLSDRIAEERRVMAKEVRQPGSCRAPQTLLTLGLDPKVAAYTVLAEALRCAAGATTAHRGAPAPTLYTSAMIGEALEVQRDYDTWLAAARGAPDDAPERVALAALRRASPDMTVKAWKRWRPKVAKFAREKLDIGEKIQVGAAFLKMLLEACPAVFEQITTQRPGFGKLTRIALTDAAGVEMTRRNVRAEMARPLHLPMLIPPLVWRWEEKES